MTMKKHAINGAVAALISIFALGAMADAPAPYPLAINSRSQTAPPLTAFRANERTFRVTFKDGSTASDVSAYVPFCNWATSTVASVVSTSSWAFVASGTNGVVDFTFDPTAVNHAAGRYIYEVGVAASNGTARSYAQGAFIIQGSPTGGGAGAVNWTTNMNWNKITWTGYDGASTSYVTASVVAEALLRVAADDALGVRIDGATSGIVEAEALLRVAGDLAGSNDTASVESALLASNVLAVAAIDSEAVLRVAGDLAGSNDVDAVESALLASNVLARAAIVSGDLAGSNYVDAAILTVSTNYVMAVELTSGRYQLYLVTE